MRLSKAHKKQPTYCGRSRHSKVRYRSLKDAKSGRSALERRLGQSVRIYGCPDCDGYHLTTEAEYAYGDTRTVWKTPDREISSREGLVGVEETQDG